MHEFGRMLGKPDRSPDPDEEEASVVQPEKPPIPIPAIGYKWWLDSVGSCWQCTANAAAGEIPLNAVFPGGVSEPPQHHRCGCQMIVNPAPEDRRYNEPKPNIILADQVDNEDEE